MSVENEQLVSGNVSFEIEYVIFLLLPVGRAVAVHRVITVFYACGVRNVNIALCECRVVEHSLNSRLRNTELVYEITVGVVCRACKLFRGEAFHRVVELTCADFHASFADEISYFLNLFSVCLSHVAFAHYPAGFYGVLVLLNVGVAHIGVLHELLYRVNEGGVERGKLTLIVCVADVGVH